MGYAEGLAPSLFDLASRLAEPIAFEGSLETASESQLGNAPRIKSASKYALPAAMAQPVLP